jgi:mono/diheme cytochrome c family protein
MSVDHERTGSASVMPGDGRLLCILAAGLALSSCTADHVASTPAPAAAPAPAGRQLAEQKCAGCHAIGETDTSPNPRSPALRDLYRRYPLDGLRDAFANGLEVGHRDMPHFILKPAEIDSLVDYLRSLNPCDKPSSDQAAMAKCFAPMAR